MKSTVYLVCVSLLVSCSNQHQVGYQDPLENTKKLMKKGHGDLYENGALKVPYTEVKVIPAGPSTTELAGSLIGINARESFLLALKNVASTHKLVKAGTLKSWKVSKKIHNMTGDVTHKINDLVDDQTLYLVKSSLMLPLESWSESLEIVGETQREILEAEWKLRKITQKFGKETKRQLLNQSSQSYQLWKRQVDSMASDMREEAKRADQYFSQKSRRNLKSMWRKGGELQDHIIKSGREYDSEMSQQGSRSYHNMTKRGKEVDQSFSQFGDRLEQSSSNLGKKLKNKMIQASLDFDQLSKEKAQKNFKNASRYIKGYLSLPKKMSILVDETAMEFGEFSKAYERSNRYRKKMNSKLDFIWSEYSIQEDTQKSLQRANSSFKNQSSSIGYTFAAIKSLSWLTKLVFWDLFLKPIGHASFQAVGYLTSNAIIFPTLLMANAGVASTLVAVKVVENTALGVYEISAPTIKAGLSSSLAFLQYTGGKLGAGSMFLSAKPIEYGIKFVGKGSSYTAKTLGKLGLTSAYGAGTFSNIVLKGTGKLLRAQSYLVGPILNTATKATAVSQSIVMEPTGKILSASTYGGSYLLEYGGTGLGQVIKGSGYAGAHLINVGSRGGGQVGSFGLKYIGVPLATLGIPTTYTAVGVGAGAIGLASGSSLYGAGKVIAGSTFVFGNTLAGATLVTGAAASTIAAGAASAWEIGKGVTVPAAYTLGSGVVFNYGMLTQLGAQALLSVSDAAYLVLSLEGPRWVVYAVSGKLGKGHNLKPGAVLDLEKMQSEGEEIKAVPVPVDRLKKVLDKIAPEAKVKKKVKKFGPMTKQHNVCRKICDRKMSLANLDEIKRYGRVDPFRKQLRVEGKIVMKVAGVNAVGAQVVYYDCPMKGK